MSPRTIRACGWVGASFRLVEIGEGGPELAELAPRLAAGNQGVEVARLELERAVEIADGAAEVAGARGQQHAALQIDGLVLGVPPDGFVIVGERPIGLAEALFGNGAAKQVERVGMGGIERAVVVLQRFEIVFVAADDVAQHGAGDAARQASQRHLVRPQAPRLQGLRASLRALPGIIFVGPVAEDACAVEPAGVRRGDQQCNPIEGGAARDDRAADGRGNNEQPGRHSEP
jgi:hypothetical protein